MRVHIYLKETSIVQDVSLDTFEAGCNTAFFIGNALGKIAHKLLRLGMLSFSKLNRLTTKPIVQMSRPNRSTTTLIYRALFTKPKMYSSLDSGLIIVLIENL